MTADDVRKRLRLLMALRGMNQKAVAGTAGVSSAFVSAVLAGDKEPSEKICALVGVKRRVIYEKCGKSVNQGADDSLPTNSNSAGTET